MACVPGQLSGTETGEDTCEGLSFNDVCFTRMSLGLDGTSIVEWVADLDADGDDELLLSRSALLVVAELREGQPFLRSIESPVPVGGWVLDGQLTDAAGRELILSGSDTFLLAADESSLTRIAEFGDLAFGPMGSVGRGDGLSDLIAYTSAFPETRIRVLAGGAWDDVGEALSSPGCGSNENAVQGDFNGDGLRDALFVGVVGACEEHPDTEAPTPLHLLYFQGDQVVDVVREAAPRAERGSVGDINGDQIEDVLLWSPGSRVATLLWGAVIEPLALSDELELGEDDEFLGLANFGGGHDIAVLRAGSLWVMGDPLELMSGLKVMESERYVTFADLNGDGVDEIIDRSSSPIALFVSQKKK